MSRLAWLTPDNLPSTGIRRWLCIPDEPALLAAVTGALLPLTYAENWELYGTETPDDVALAMSEMLEDFLAQESLCMPLLSQPTLLVDKKTQNTAGGGTTLGSFQTRALNTIEGNINLGVTLSSNQFTLPAGRWLVRWSAPAYECGQHQTRLYDVTGNSVVVYGTSMQGGASTDAETRSEGRWTALINTPNVFRIEHRTSGTKATNGFGVAANFAEERYTWVEIYLIS